MLLLSSAFNYDYLTGTCHKLKLPTESKLNTVCRLVQLVVRAHLKHEPLQIFAQTRNRLWTARLEPSNLSGKLINPRFYGAIRAPSGNRRSELRRRARLSDDRTQTLHLVCSRCSPEFEPGYLRGYRMLLRVLLVAALCYYNETDTDNYRCPTFY